MGAIHFLGPQQVLLHSARQVVQSAATITATGSSAVYKGIGLPVITVSMKVTGAVSGAGASLVLSVEELDPSDLSTVLQTVSAAAVNTTLSVRTVRLALKHGDAVRVSWTVAGTTPSFGGVNIMLSAGMGEVPISQGEPAALASSSWLMKLTDGVNPIGDLGTRPLHVRLTDGATSYKGATGMLPAMLGQQNKAGSVSVTIASDQHATSGVTTANVPATTSSTQLLAANSNRKSFSVYNDSTAILTLKIGTGASATSMTVKIPAKGYYAPPCEGITVAITGLWSAPNGAARMTEITYS